MLTLCTCQYDALHLNMQGVYRWGTHTDALDALLHNKRVLRDMVEDRDQHQIIVSACSYSAAAKQQRAEMVAVIMDSHFWQTIEDAYDLMLPLKIAIRMLEADAASLDSILIVFSRLYDHFQSRVADDDADFDDIYPQQSSYAKSMMEAIDKRFINMGCVLPILCYILRPGQQVQFPKMTFLLKAALSASAGAEQNCA